MSRQNEFNEKIADVPGHMVGYRLWRISKDLQLTAVHHANFIWEPGKNQAFCDQMYGDDLGDHMKDHSCGFYALYDPLRVIRELPCSPYGGGFDTSIVAGVIHATGLIAIGKTGFKCSSATIKALSPVFALDSPFDNRMTISEAIKTAARSYGVPLFCGMAELVREFPPVDVSELVEDLNTKRPDTQPVMTSPNVPGLIHYPWQSLTGRANPYQPQWTYSYTTNAANAVVPSTWTYVVENGTTFLIDQFGNKQIIADVIGSDLIDEFKKFLTNPGA